MAVVISERFQARAAAICEAVAKARRARERREEGEVGSSWALCEM